MKALLGVPHLPWAIIVGFLFGVALQRARITRYETIVEVLRFKDLTVIKFMMSAVIVAMVGLHFLKDLGLIRFYIPSAKLFGNVIGGIIFGLGFALFGG